MNIENSNEYGVLDILKLEEFESQLGCQLPTDYREFLIESNGGTPEDYLVCWPGSEEPSEVWNDSYGIHDGPSYSRLDYVARQMREYLPEGVIGFASDPGGNMFCIGIKNEYAGKIYFWNHERDQGDMSIELLSESFNEFVSNLVNEENA